MDNIKSEAFINAGMVVIKKKDGKPIWGIIKKGGDKTMELANMLDRISSAIAKFKKLSEEDKLPGTILSGSYQL